MVREISQIRSARSPLLANERLCRLLVKNVSKIRRKCPECHIDQVGSLLCTLNSADFTGLLLKRSWDVEYSSHHNVSSAEYHVLSAVKCWCWLRCRVVTLAQGTCLRSKPQILLCCAAAVVTISCGFDIPDQCAPINARPIDHPPQRIMWQLMMVQGIVAKVAAVV